MRIKFLSVIVSFLLISFGMSSCLGDDEPINYSPNAIVQAFELDTVFGVKYKFTIDQLGGKIYNQDSLPVGSDTIIDKILITKLTVAGFVTIRNAADDADSLLNISDSIDLRKPLAIKVWAPDMENTRSYEIKVNVHQQDPDSLNWGNPKGEEPEAIKTNFSNGQFNGYQKAVILNGNILVYSMVNSQPVAYKTSIGTSRHPGGKDWTNVEGITGLPNTVDLSSMVQFKNNLYVVADNQLYYSLDGAIWTLHPTLNKDGYNLETLLASFPVGATGENLNGLTGISGIITVNGTAKFCISDKDAKSWIEGEQVPGDFPRIEISSTVHSTNTGVQGGTLMGRNSTPRNDDEAEKDPQIPWGITFDGKSWVDLSTESDFYCPALVMPSIMYYNNVYYAFGNDFKKFYTSVASIVWKDANKKFYFPKRLTNRAGSNYSMVVDENGYIWIMCSKSETGVDEVWRARLNKISFENNKIME